MHTIVQPKISYSTAKNRKLITTYMYPPFSMTEERFPFPLFSATFSFLVTFYRFDITVCKNNNDAVQTI